MKVLRYIDPSVQHTDSRYR